MSRSSDTLFVAITRPEMKWGVPWDGIRANVLITSVFTTVIISNPLGFFMGFGFHYAMRALCRVDPHFFWRWRLFFATKAKSTSSALFGGSSLHPSTSRTRKAAQMRSSL